MVSENGGDHVMRRGALEHHAVDLDLERLARQPGVDSRSEQDDPPLRDRTGRGPQERSHVAVARQVGVHERELGRERPEARFELVGAGAAACDLEAGRLEQSPQRVTDQLVWLRDHEPQQPLPDVLARHPLARNRIPSRGGGVR